MLCQFCQSEEARNFHHLIPRTLHANKWFKRRFTREQMAEGGELCRACHREIHDQIPTAKELGRYYNTLDKLCAHPKLAKYLAWKRSHK